MNNKALKLSLVIPVYNEEDQIKACLEAVARQTIMPDEVLVIDNNCTDKTMAIAKTFPFVKTIHEKTQGLIAARNRGFNVATGDILGRIDADSQIDESWVARVKSQFKDQSLGGLTGIAQTAAFPAGSMTTTMWSRLYFFWREATFGHRVMWGANMAISRTAWQYTKDSVCLDDSKVHEDQDLSSLIIRFGGVIWCDTKLKIITDGRSYNNWPKFYEYCIRAHKTKKLHLPDLITRGAQATRLRLWQRAWRYATCILPGIFFVSSSLIMWALNAHRKVV